MKKISATILVMTLCLHFSNAQNVATEINTQVWKPFIESFNNHDTKSFMDLHSRDVIRSPRDAKVVWNWQQYFQQQQRHDNNEIASKSSRKLELRFIERIHGAEQGIEVGIYKTTYTQTDGITRSFYGRFHVALRKENGVWKILVDTDSSEGGSVTEKEFLEAAPLE